MVGDHYYGEDISGWYQREVEAPFSRHFLKGEGEPPTFEALVFDTGRNEWREFGAWPPEAASVERLYLRPRGRETGWKVEALRGPVKRRLLLRSRERSAALVPAPT